MDSLDLHAASPPRALVGVSLVQGGPRVVWPEAGDSAASDDCPALHLLRAAAATAPLAQLTPPLRFRTLPKGYCLPAKRLPSGATSRAPGQSVGGGGDAARAGGVSPALAVENERPTSSSHREWSEPKGLLQAGWFRKHFTEIPSVLLLPVRFEPHPEQGAWQAVENGIVQCASEARRSLSGRPIRCVLICICPRDYPIERETKERLHVAQDRLRNLRLRVGADKNECHLLYTADLNDPQSLNMKKVMKSVHGVSLDYYKTASKRTRDHKRHVLHSQGLSPPGRLLLQARHNLKTGVFYEFRGQASKSTKHMQTCFGKLVELAQNIAQGSAESRSTHVTLEEVKAVASLVSYTLCRQQIWQRRPDLAEAQFELLIRTFRSLRSRPPVDARAGARASNDLLYKCRMWAWVGVQSEIFAELLMHARANGIPLAGDGVAKDGARARGKTGKKGRGGAASGPGPGFWMCTHLQNAMQAHQRRAVFSARLRQMCGQEGGVALDPGEREEIAPSAYVGGLPCFGNATPSVMTVTGDMTGFIAVHKWLCARELEFDTQAHVVELAMRTLEALRDERGLSAGTSVTVSPGAVSSPDEKFSRKARSRRANCIALIAAREMVSKGQYEKAAAFLKPAICLLRRDGWPVLTVTALHLARECAIKGGISNSAEADAETMANSPSFALSTTLQLLGVTEPGAVPEQEQRDLHDSVFVRGSPGGDGGGGGGGGGPRVTFNMEQFQSRLVQSKVSFREEVVQAKDTLHVAVEITSALCKPVPLSYIRLVLQHVDLVKSTAAEADAASSRSVEAENLKFVCVLAAVGMEEQARRHCAKMAGGEDEDGIVVVLPFPDVMTAGEGPDGRAMLRAGGVSKFNFPVTMDVAEAFKMPKQGAVIFPTEISICVPCNDVLGPPCTLEFFSDLAYERGTNTAQMLHVVDPYKSPGVLSLLRPPSSRDGSVVHERGAAHSVRLIPPVSILDVTLSQERVASFNDWHPVLISIRLDDDILHEQAKHGTALADVVSAEALELSLWVSDKAGRALSGDDVVELLVRDKDGEDHKVYDPQSPAIMLGNLPQGKTLTVSCCVRFRKDGIPAIDEQHQLNVTVGHRTSRKWQATAHCKAQIIVSSPLRMNVRAVPTSSATGFAKLMAGTTSKTKESDTPTVCQTGDLIAVVATIRNASSFSLDVSKTTLLCAEEKEIGTLSGDTGCVVTLAPDDHLTRVFVMPANVAVDGPTGNLGSLRCHWKRPSTAARKDVSRVMNTSTVELPRLVVVEPPAVSVHLLAPSETVVGDVFDMLLEIQNRSTARTTVQFSMRLGSEFLCAGRMRGSQVVQPLSVTRTRFRLIGVSPGSMELPAVIVKEGEAETVVVDGTHVGSILVLPRGVVERV